MERRGRDLRTVTAVQFVALSFTTYVSVQVNQHVLKKNLTNTRVLLRFKNRPLFEWPVLVYMPQKNHIALCDVIDLYQPSIILNHFEGLKLTLASLKISYLEQLNSKISASLSTRFSCLKIDRLIKRIGITS